MMLPKESATFSSCRFNCFMAFLIPNSRYCVIFKQFLNLTDIKIFSVLNSDTNPILAQFDKVFGNSTANMPDTTFDDYENWAMKIILERYNGDLKLLEQDVRSKFSSRSGATKRMKKFETVYHAMTSAQLAKTLLKRYVICYFDEACVSKQKVYQYNL